MKRWILILTSGLACTGCTTWALERHTLAQGESAADLRYQEVLDNLALVAQDPAALPAYSSIFAGTAQVVDTEQVSSATLWVGKSVMGTARAGFLSETGTPQLSRSVSENWSLDPLIAPEKIEALRCACRWVLYGPQEACASCPGLLESPDEAPTPGRHFGVADRLAQLPPGWLHVGGLKDVPLAAPYKAHCDDAWVWVLPDGLEGLADFTLVFQDVARVNINSESLFHTETPPCVFARGGELNPLLVWAASAVGSSLGSPQGLLTAPALFPGKGFSRPMPTLEVSAYVDRQHHLVPGFPYRPIRFENLGADSSLRSQVSASGAP